MNQGSTSFGCTQGTSDNRPTLLAAAPSGANVVAFDSDDNLRDPGSQHLLAAGDRTVTIAYRFTVAPITTRECIYELAVNDIFSRKESASNTGDITMWDDNGTKVLVATGHDSNTNWHIATIVGDSGTDNTKTYFDGVATATGTSDQSGAINRLLLGKMSSSAQTAGQEILGISIYSRALSEVEVWEVQRYYNDLGTLGLTIPAAPVTPAAGILGIGTFPQDG